MTISTAVRQPAGISTGGQFAATVHAEPSIALSAGGPRFVTTADLFEVAQMEATSGAPVLEFDPSSRVGAKRLLGNRTGLPRGKVRRVNLDGTNSPESRAGEYVEVAGPADGRPIIVDITAGLPSLRVTSGLAVIAADSRSGNSITVGPGAEAVIVSSPQSRVNVTVEDDGYAVFMCTSENNRFRAYPEGDGRIDVMYGSDPERRPYESPEHRPFT